MTSHPKPTPQKKVLLISVAVAIVFSLGIRFMHLQTGMKHYHQLFFLENGTPLMTAMDAYYYLRITDTYLSGEQSIGPGSAPRLAVVTASVHKLTQIPIEKIAFYLSPLLALFTILVYFWWGREFGGTFVWLASALIGMGSYYWYMHTCLGRFDTDSLIPFFVYGISFWVYRFSVVDPWKKRLVYLASALVMAYFFQWWWKPARYLNIFLLASPYAVSFLFWPSNRVEKALKIALFALGLTGIMVVVFDLGHRLPGPLAPIFQSLSIYFKLVAKSPASALSGATGQSISELQAPSWHYLCQMVAGHASLLILSVAGLGLLIKKHYRIITFLTFPILLASASVMAQRFLIHFIPLYALGLAYVLKWISGLKPLRKIPFKPRQWIMAVLCLAVLGLNTKKALVTTINPKVKPRDVALALDIKKDSSQNALIWAWWDSGYFLQFYAGLKTIIGGGNQNSDRIFVTAFPLTTDNPVLARNWMKFFAARGISALHEVNKYFNDLGKSINFLKTALARPERLDAVMTRFELKDKKYWGNYLFPRARVYVYLPYNLINDAYWWFYFGSWDTIRKSGVHPAAAILPGHFSIDPDRGSIVINKRTVRISDLYYVTLKPELHTNGHKRYRHASRMGVIWVKDHDLAFVFDAQLLNSLFTKLVLLNPLAPPAGFTPVRYIPFHGGVWRVE